MSAKVIERVYEFLNRELPQSTIRASLERVQKVAAILDKPTKADLFLSLPDRKVLTALLLLPLDADQRTLLIRLASCCRLSDDKVAESIAKLLAEDVDPNPMVYVRRYATPEVIPQQYASKIPEIWRFHNQWIDVYYLLDQMVGYKLEDGTEFTAGKKIKV